MDGDGDGSTNKDRLDAKIGDFAKRKTIAAAFLDTALLLANVAQLKTLLDTDPDCEKGKTIALIVFISISMTLQVIAGLLLIYLTHYEHGWQQGVIPRQPCAADLALEDGSKISAEQWRLQRAMKAVFTTNTIITMTVFATLIVNIIISGVGLSIEKAEKPNLDHLGLNLTTTT